MFRRLLFAVVCPDGHLSQVAQGHNEINDEIMVA
jgi:hypothetical protein